MKNMKKLVSLLLAVCLMASLSIGASAAEPTTVDVSGGTGTSSVSLSSTSDGTLDGDPAATKMNVTIPTILPIAVGTDGTVTTATDIRITNNSYGAVKVDNVKVEAGTGWKLTAFGSKDSLAKVKVDSNMIGFKLALGGGAADLLKRRGLFALLLLFDLARLLAHLDAARRLLAQGALVGTVVP